ncbi:GNAT family N-acetyltransferase [Kitasatospora viridis]|uniref:Ribosomal-protein-alanine N-acetyltransferase n=1 Tax=Kitasatospora viridis TaxID=281105 RepID=A0A561T7J9_9ACTN|nr:GNAT family protein [Kitasatospora viridis]TWF83083.1 ribosomal-protein-alanine N-acetyltransferase [Kitasatospora viridis]
MSIDYFQRGDRVAIRHLTPADRAEFTRLAQENRELHHPWISLARTDEEFDALLARFADHEVRQGFVICLPETDELVGYVSISNIVRNAFQNGTLGYGAFVSGRGLVTEGVGLLLRHAFDTLGLHRLEINVQPANTGSIAVAKRLGFRLEGVSPDMLFIDGAWRDHERWAITADLVTG